jgi:hypothetical protein
LYELVNKHCRVALGVFKGDVALGVGDVLRELSRSA